MIETSSDLLRQSSAMSKNLWEMFGNVRLVFGLILENLRKSPESGRKSSENRHILCSKKKITNFSTPEDNFVSPRGHVISSI